MSRIAHTELLPVEPKKSRGPQRPRKPQRIPRPRPDKDRGLRYKTMKKKLEKMKNNDAFFQWLKSLQVPQERKDRAQSAVLRAPRGLKFTKFQIMMILAILLPQVAVAAGVDQTTSFQTYVDNPSKDMESTIVAEILNEEATQAIDEEPGKELDEESGEKLDEESGEKLDEDSGEKLDEDSEKYNPLVEFRDKLSKDWNTGGWLSFLDPSDEDRLETNADYAEKVLSHVDSVMYKISASSAKKLDNYMKPVIKAISVNLMNQMIAHDHSFVNASVNIALGDTTYKTIQQERMNQMVTKYSSTVDYRLKENFTDMYIRDVASSLTSDNIIGWYQKHKQSSTPEQLFREYTHDYTSGVMKTLDEMDDKTLTNVTDDMFFKTIIMDVALSSQDIKDKVDSGEWKLDIGPNNPVRKAIISSYKKKLQTSTGINMPSGVRMQLKLYASCDDTDEGKCDQIVDDVSILWKLFDSEMDKNLKAAEQKKNEDLYQGYWAKETQLLRDSYNQMLGGAQSLRQIFEKMMDNIFYIGIAGIVLGSLGSLTGRCGICSTCRPCRRSHQSTSTPRSETPPPRPRTRTTSRTRTTVRRRPLAKSFDKGGIEVKALVNQTIAVFGLEGHMTAKGLYKKWIPDKNRLRRISIKNGMYRTGKTTNQTARELWIPLGYIDEDGVFHSTS